MKELLKGKKRLGSGKDFEMWGFRVGLIDLFFQGLGNRLCEIGLGALLQG